MIVFERVKLKNFFSFGEQVVEVPLTKHKFTLIHGDSGSGKSTIVVEAITYALFGKPFRQIKKNEVINTVNGRDCLLDVEFKIGKSQFRVVRGVKPDIFEIYKNGKMVNQNPTVRDYQKYLEDSILKMSYKTWTQIVALGFANHTPFMLLSAGARRQMVDEVLGIEIFQRMYLLAKDRINEKKQELTNIEHSIVSTKQTIEVQKKNLKQIQAQEKEKEEELQVEVDKLNERIDELQSKITGMDVAAAELIKTLEAGKKHKKKLADIKELLTKLKVSRTQVQGKIAFIEENVACPTCRQSISEEYRSSFKEEEEKRDVELRDSIEALTEKLHEYQDLVMGLEVAVDSLSEIETKKAIDQKSIDHYQEEIQKKQKEIQRLSTSDNNLVREIASSIVDLSEKNQAAVTLKGEITEEIRHLVACGTMLKEDGIKGKIIQLYLPVLTKLVNEFLEEMNFMMRVQFDEDFNETIYARFRDKLSFSQLSQGEQSRINIAIILAWRQLAELRNSVKTNVLICDELLDTAISAADVEAVMHMIQRMAKDQNCFIISHKPDSIAAYCDNVIRVEKRGNFSKIVEGI